MRKSFIAAIALICVSGFGQVPNGGFEVWPSDCELEAWSINSVCDVMMPITRTTEAHSGSFALRGEVISLFGQVTMQPVLQSGEDATGFPISQRYTSVDGFYRFAPVGGDRFGFNVAFYKGETVVAQGAKFFPATTGTAYVACSTPMVYQTEDVPDRAIIQVQIIGPVTGSDYHVGSVMYLDDVTFGGGGSTEPEPRLTITINGNFVTVSWPQEVTGYRLQQTATLPATSWSDVALSATDRAYTFTPTTQAFFRLIKP